MPESVREMLNPNINQVQCVPDVKEVNVDDRIQVRCVQWGF